MIFKPLPKHNSIKLSPFSFLPSTPQLPTTPLTSLSPTLAFISPNMHTFWSNPKPCSTLSKLSQNSNLSSLLLSLPGPYTLTNIHFSFPIFTFTHKILEDTHLDSYTNFHNSFFIINPTPSFALTLSFTPDIKPLLSPNCTHPLPFNFVSHTANTSIPSSLNIIPISSLFSSLFTPSHSDNTLSIYPRPYLPDLPVRLRDAH